MRRNERLKTAWLTALETRAVMAALDAGEVGASRFVGGCVRNTIMKRAVADIDIATQLLPDAVMRACDAAGLKTVPTGLEHGTVTAIAGKTPFEITTLRRDVETDGRRAVIAYTRDWAEDAHRRDFRLNALYADADGTLHEEVEGSLDDARTGAVIFIGEADDRLREDFLRILRFFRFNAWYGAGIDAEGLAACARQRDGLAQISAERLWKELVRTLEAPDPSTAMEAMEASGVLEAVLPGATANRLPALIAMETASDVAPEAMARVMALVARRPREVEALSTRLKVSNAERDRLSAWAEPGLLPVLGLPQADLKRAAYRHGVPAVRDRALLEAADDGDAAGLKAVLGALANWKRPQMPVMGGDALAFGLDGPAVGEALRALEAQWIDSDFSLSRKQLLEALAERPRQTR